MGWVITGYKGPRCTVLVVDDIPSNRVVLVDMLAPEYNSDYREKKDKKRDTTE